MGRNPQTSQVVSGNKGSFDCVRLMPHFAPDDKEIEFDRF
jgi:hypothetical protein